jgi:S1-C subfamily serine protease
MQRLALVFLVLPCATVLAAEDGTSVSRAFKRVDGAVVVVRTASYTPVGPGRGRTVAGAGIGSGVLISQKGKVLTAAHVVQAADAVVVEFRNGETVAARVVSADSAADVALLEVEHIPRGIAPVALGDSDRVEVGDQVFVVGTPFGMSHTLSVGHVSARRNERIENPFATPAELFQTDAALNAGNSGGPMFNLDGEVIGIVSVIVSRSGGSDGLGFAVTSNAAWQFVIDEPSVWSGVQGFLLIDDVARAFNVPGAAGLLVQHVATGSPAERLGLRSGSMPVTVGTDTLVIGGDVVIAVDGIALGAPDAQETIRRRLIEMHRNRTSIHLTVLRGGELLELTGPI